MAVALDQMLGDDAGSGQRRDERKSRWLMKLAACIAASAMPTTGPGGDLAGRQQSGVAEAGDDIAVATLFLAFPNFLQHA